MAFIAIDFVDMQSYRVYVVARRQNICQSQCVVQQVHFGSLDRRVKRTLSTDFDHGHGRKARDFELQDRVERVADTRGNARYKARRDSKRSRR